MKRLTLFAALAGLILFSILMAFSGAGEVFEAVASAGWIAALLIVAVRAAAIAADGVGWRSLFPPADRPSLATCLLIRWIREGANQLLPVAQIGGDFIGARLVTSRRCEPALAWASVIADIAVQAGTQFVFATVGLGLLLFLVGDNELARYLGGGLVLAALGIGGFFLLQRRGGSKLLMTLGRKLAGGREWGGLAAVEKFYARLGDIYGRPAGVGGSVLVHLGVWFFGALEVWIALHYMGHPVTVTEAIVIESLGQAVRGAAFAVPGAIGVQEGGFIALCALFGIPAGPALALSLLKRVADLAIGLPGLLAWQWMEGRRLFARSAGRSAEPIPDSVR